MILSCICVHPMQDRLHGVGRRVMNRCPPKQGRGETFRCTVCGKDHNREAKT